VGKIAVICVILLGVAVPAMLSAAPGNPSGELAREEAAFQGMFDQLCRLSASGGSYEAAMNAINARRRAAYQRRGRPYPGDLFCEGGGEEG
jgi:hypothetical protein